MLRAPCEPDTAGLVKRAHTAGLVLRGEHAGFAARGKKRACYALLASQILHCLMKRAHTAGLNLREAGSRRIRPALSGPPQPARLIWL